VALVCAHRGCTQDDPENTAAAFEAAIRLGVDMVETDVRRSGDGQIVLAHDPLDGASADGLCRLSELVALAAGRVALDVELKEQGFEREALALLRPYPPGLVVTSFLDGCLAAVAAADPAVTTGLLIAPDDSEGRYVERALGGRDRAGPADFPLGGVDDFLLFERLHHVGLPPLDREFEFSETGGLVRTPWLDRPDFVVRRRTGAHPESHPAGLHPA